MTGYYAAILHLSALNIRPLPHSRPLSLGWLAGEDRERCNFSGIILLQDKHVLFKNPLVFVN